MRSSAPKVRLPLVTRSGFALLVVGLALDLLHHAGASEQTNGSMTASFGHFLTLAGMVLALVGVINTAARSARREKGRR